MKLSLPLRIVHIPLVFVYVCICIYTLTSIHYLSFHPPIHHAILQSFDLQCTHVHTRTHNLTSKVFREVEIIKLGGRAVVSRDQIRDVGADET